jgi:hypothetical protein
MFLILYFISGVWYMYRYIVEQKKSMNLLSTKTFFDRCRYFLDEVFSPLIDASGYEAIARRGLVSLNYTLYHCIIVGKQSGLEMF